MSEGIAHCKLSSLPDQHAAPVVRRTRQQVRLPLSVQVALRRSACARIIPYVPVKLKLNVLQECTGVGDPTGRVGEALP
jgi:hypothetical protein